MDIIETLKKYKRINDQFECLGNILIEYTGNDEVVYIPEGIKKIGDMAFRRAPENTKVIHLPSSVTTIGIAAFAYCPSLEYVYGEHVTEIHEYAFWGCKKMKKGYFPKLKKYYNEAFHGTFMSVHMPSKAKILWLSRWR